MKLPVCFRLLSALPLTVSPVSALMLQIDFNDSGVTQSGWQSISSGENDPGDSWSKNFPGGIGLDVDPIGSVALDDRDRGTNNGGGGRAADWSGGGSATQRPPLLRFRCRLLRLIVSSR